MTAEWLATVAMALWFLLLVGRSSFPPRLATALGRRDPFLLLNTWHFFLRPQRVNRAEYQELSASGLEGPWNALLLKPDFFHLEETALESWVVAQPGAPREVALELVRRLIAVRMPDVHGRLRVRMIALDLESGCQFISEPTPWLSISS